jgi:hypothetical protein
MRVRGSIDAWPQGKRENGVFFAAACLNVIFVG